MPTDFSPTAASALDHALLLARHFGAELHLFHATTLRGEPAPGEPTADGFPELAEVAARLRELAKGELERLAEAHGGGPLEIRTVERRVFFTGPAIVEYAGEIGADLIVMGAHGRRGLQRFLLGSVAEEVVHRAPCPVLTLRAGTAARAPRTIVAPHDFSPPSRAALGSAKELAATFGARLVVVHVVPPPLAPQLVEVVPATSRAWSVAAVASEIGGAVRAEVERAAGPDVAVETRVVEGFPAQAIADEAAAASADLVVIATRGAGGLERGLLGSVAERVVRLAPCPVLTLRGDGGEPPAG